MNNNLGGIYDTINLWFTVVVDDTSITCVRT